MRTHGANAYIEYNLAIAMALSCLDKNKERRMREKNSRQGERESEIGKRARKKNEGKEEVL